MIDQQPSQKLLRLLQKKYYKEKVCIAPEKTDLTEKA